MRWFTVVLIALTACSAGPGSGTESRETVTLPATSAGPATTEPPGGTDAPATTEASDTTTAPAIEEGSAEGCADVIDATMVADSNGGYTVSATVSSADTGWEKYADLWTVSVDGVVVGERVLTHPHETEQPFTRSLSGVVVPSGVTEAEIAASDSVAGFCGETFVVPVPG